MNRTSTFGSFAQLCVAGLCVVSATASAQTPTQYEALLHDVAQIDQLQIASVDYDALRKRTDMKTGEAPQFAVAVAESWTSDDRGTWETLADGRHVWRLRVQAPGAHSINFGFARYHMPVGGRLFVHATASKNRVRPFTEADNRAHGELWTPPLPVDDVILEVTLLPGTRPVFVLEGASVNVGFRSILTKDHEPGASGACNVNVVCSAADGYPQIDSWRDEISSVAVISLGGTTFCTGFMVNNTSQDRRPLFMTARHCGINAQNAASLVAYWNYENSDCTLMSGSHGDATLDRFTTGSTHRASLAASDFSLVELDANPDLEWRVAYAGWDARDFDATGGVGIHHPSTEQKAISFEYEALEQTATYGNDDVVTLGGTHVLVNDWDVGTTEPGSSGSPLFDIDTHRVLGQLHGGQAACGNDAYDSYGKFSYSWDNGTTVDSLRPWLDPLGSGDVFVDTLSSRGLTVSPASEVVHLGTVGGPFSAATTTYTLSDPIGAGIQYVVRLGPGTAPMTVNGGTQTLLGYLAPAGPSQDVRVDVDVAAASVLSPGVYGRDVLFLDYTHGLSLSRQHVIEVGTTGFVVTDDSGLEIAGPVGGPYVPSSKVYTITSDRPTPVDVEIRSLGPWVTVDGSGPRTVTLSGVGASIQVDVALDTHAFALPRGRHEARVQFLNRTDGTRGSTERTVGLDAGRFGVDATGLPVELPDRSTVAHELDFDEDACIDDLDVALDVRHSWIGDLTVDLTSPQGTRVRLYDRDGGGADQLRTLFDDGAPAGSTERAVPSESLAGFNGESTLGLWTLTVTDHARRDEGQLLAWSLRPSSDGPCGQSSFNANLVCDEGVDRSEAIEVEREHGDGSPTRLTFEAPVVPGLSYAVRLHYLAPANTLFHLTGPNMVWHLRQTFVSTAGTVQGIMDVNNVVFGAQRRFNILLPGADAAVSRIEFCREP